MSDRSSIPARPGPAEATSSMAREASPRKRHRRSLSPRAARPFPELASGRGTAQSLSPVYNPPLSLAKLLRSPSPISSPTERRPVSLARAASVEDELEETDSEIESARFLDLDSPTTGIGSDWLVRSLRIDQLSPTFQDLSSRDHSTAPTRSGLRVWRQGRSVSLTSAHDAGPAAAVSSTYHSPLGKRCYGRISRRHVSISFFLQFVNLDARQRHLDINFLVLMVDLWSSDGQDQRNVVMHPSSQNAGEGPSPRRSATDLGQMISVPAPASRPTTAMSRPGTGYSIPSLWPGDPWRGVSSELSIAIVRLRGVFR